MKTTTVTLSEADRARLAEANRLLTALTATHSHACECQLCEAGWRTDVQEEPACWTIPGVTAAQPEAKPSAGAATLE